MTTQQDNARGLPIGLLMAGIALGVIGGVTLTNDEESTRNIGIILLAAAGIVGQVGAIAVGVQLGLAAHAAPPVERPAPTFADAPVSMRSAPPPDGDGAPSVRIVTEPTRQRSDAHVMVLLGVGIVLTIMVVGLIVVALRG